MKKKTSVLLRLQRIIDKMDHLRSINKDGDLSKELQRLENELKIILSDISFIDYM